MARCIAKPVHSPFAPWCSPVAVPRGRAPCCAPSLPCPIVWSRCRTPWPCAPRVRLGGRARCPHRAARSRDPVPSRGPVAQSHRASPLPCPVVQSRCGRARCPHRAAAPRRGALLGSRAPTHVAWQIAHAESFAGGVSVRPIPPAGAPGPRRARRLSSPTYLAARPARSRPRAAPKIGNKTAPKNHLPFSPKSNILQTTFVNFPR